MKLLKKMSFLLFASLIIIACAKDDEDITEPAAVITGLDFTITPIEAGNTIEVLPTAAGATSFSVDFGSDATDDVLSTVGPKVAYTYPTGAATYDITVTASAAGLDNVVLAKPHTISFTAPTSLANFEDDAEVAVYFTTSATEGIIQTVETATADAGGTYGKVGKVVYDGASTGWKSVSVKTAKHIDLAVGSVITADIYLEANTPSLPVTLKMEGINTENADANTKIEKGATTTATTAAGWQTLTFDFSDNPGRSGDANGSTFVLTEFNTMTFFIGVTITDGTGVEGTYELDNISGSDWGSDVADTDADGVIDSVDACPNDAGTVENDGCPAGVDTDGDGVADTDDTCPDTAADVPVDATGCPVITNISYDPTDGFEGNGNIPDPSWSGDGAELNVSFANPSKTGINLSDTVLEYNDIDGQYANIYFDLAADKSARFDLTTKNTITVKVFVPTPTEAHAQPKQLSIKLQNSSFARPWEKQSEVIVTYEYDVWQELTFDFSGLSDTTENYTRVLLQFNGEDNTEPVKAYIDDFGYGN